MLAETRRTHILNELKINNSILVKDLSEKLCVTQETIRRDLKKLEAEGKLIKTHGGAYIRDGVNNDIDVRIRETLYVDVKEKIGTVCVDLINDGETILLDASTTSLQIAKHLKEKRVTVLTNSLLVAEELSNIEMIKLVLLGGTLDHHSLSFLGFDTLSMLEKYFVDRAFVSCRGIDMVAGITDSNESQALIRNKMIQSGRKKYLIIDKTKLDIVAFSKISHISEFDYVIIEELNSEWEEYFNNYGIQVIYA
ncbi:HTH-type transcriptional repressor GlcR [compost metagenome]